MHRGFLLATLMVIACTEAAPVNDPIEPEEPGYAIPGLPSEHPCVQYGQEEAWGAEEGLDCAAGFEDGHSDGFDAGRLVCIMGDAYCPECVGDGNGTWSDSYRFGYLEGYRTTYKDGWVNAGCTLPEN